MPEGTEVPSDWRPLSPDFGQDPRLIELDAALQDVGSGLSSGCLTLPQARSLVVAALARLGLDRWSVASERGRADGTHTCTAHYLDREGSRVVLIPLAGAAVPGDAAYAILARRLATATAHECLILDAAVQFARSEAASLAIEEASGAIVFHAIEADGCAGHRQRRRAR